MMTYSNPKPMTLKIIELIYDNFRKLLIINLSIILATLIYLLFFTTPIYRSSATVVVQNDNQPGSALLSTVSDMLPIGLGIGGGTDIDKYIAFGNSRRIKDAIIDEFNLMEKWEIEFRDDAYRRLSNDLNVFNNDDGTFSISMVYSEEPRMASEIANFAYKELYNLAVEVAQNQAKEYREYTENNYHYWELKLEKDENALKSYQDSTNILELEEQTKIALNSIAELESQRLSAQIELDLIKGSLAPDHPDIDVKKRFITVLAEKIDTLNTTNKYGNLPVSDIPESALGFLRKLRDVKVGQKINEFLAMQLEQAKLDEHKNSANLYLLDEARPADRKFKPNRLSFLIVITFLGFIGSILFFKLKDWYKNNIDLIPIKNRK